MNVLEAVVRMLSADALEKRVAAAVVLAEVKPKDAKVLAALAKAAADPLEPVAAAAVRALGAIGSDKSVGPLLDAFARGGEVRRAASEALAGYGNAAVPAIRERMETAPAELKAALSQLLPSMGGRTSLKAALEGLYGQSFDDANKVALAVRHGVREAGEAERKGMAAQVVKFLEAKKTRENEPALRAGLKILGYLERPDVADVLLGFTDPELSPAVRIDAVVALRFGLSKGVTGKVLQRLMRLVDDRDPLVQRAARDTVSTLQLGPQVAGELETLAGGRDGEVALWAIGRLARLGPEAGGPALAAIAQRRDRGRARAAATELGGLPGGASLLAEALAKAADEEAAHILLDVLTPLAGQLSRKELSKLAKAGDAALAESVAMGRRMLEPVRHADGETWAGLVRGHAQAAKKDPGRAETLYTLLCESRHATDDDRYALARLRLDHTSRDLHPGARDRDPALSVFSQLAEGGFPVAKALLKDRKLEPDDLYFVGFHLVEQDSEEQRGEGAALLEALVKASPRSKVGKAAKNKLALAQRARGGD